MPWNMQIYAIHVVTPITICPYCWSQITLNMYFGYKQVLFVCICEQKYWFLLLQEEEQKKHSKHKATTVTEPEKHKPATKSKRFAFGFYSHIVLHSILLLTTLTSGPNFCMIVAENAAPANNRR